MDAQDGLDNLRHPRESGDPVFGVVRKSLISMDSRFRGKDEKGGFLS
jgi:hypothetical protein